MALNEERNVEDARQGEEATVHGARLIGLGTGAEVNSFAARDRGHYVLNDIVEDKVDRPGAEV